MPKSMDDHKPTERGGFRLEIRPSADPTDPGGTRRLRLLLKIMLRRFGFRCTAVSPTETASDAGKNV